MNFLQQVSIGLATLVLSAQGYSQEEQVTDTVRIGSFYEALGLDKEQQLDFALQKMLPVAYQTWAIKNMKQDSLAPFRATIYDKNHIISLEYLPVPSKNIKSVNMGTILRGGHISKIYVDTDADCQLDEFRKMNNVFMKNIRETEPLEFGFEEQETYHEHIRNFLTNPYYTLRSAANPYELIWVLDK